MYVCMYVYAGRYITVHIYIPTSAACLPNAIHFDISIYMYIYYFVCILYVFVSSALEQVS